MSIVQVQNLTKVYGAGDTTVTALDKINLIVEPGQFVAITGASGSGKSTLLHLIGGVDSPTSGKVVIEGSDIYSLNESALAIFRRRNIGLIYQFYNLIPVLNVEENITLPLLLDGRKPDDAFLADIIATLGLNDRIHHLPNQLSGGQQQRVSIGRALVNRPAILLADEPTGNLDRKNSSDIMALLLLSNRKYNQTVLLITHDESVALQADRIISIEDGRIVRDEVIRR
ncbi:MAG: ABC transporter ATP-binding protein [Oscillospiraceae bacterium]|jgi:putative ABC transport system ATP-binding protein|nr:ABC transporter ATP-binding protein [Oscillospiraceae bacterium]